ncbi:MAG TPA: hypothetical protein VN736_02750 [Candidatus Limnocylindrales bacterium]|nr:hypothetical protein [Candidatus Limnocylindrales bacterium]
MRTVFLLLAPLAALAAGPVYVRESPDAVTIGNDSLERTISLAPGATGTMSFLNKVSGRSYALRGPEFELRLINERVGYNFGNENPISITNRGLRAPTHKTEDAPNGGKRVVIQFAQAHGIELQITYELQPNDFYTRQWLHVSKPREGTYFIDWVSVARNEWGVPRFTLGGFGQPVFGEDIFLGLEYPTGINEAAGPEANLGRYVGMNIPAEGYTTDTAVIGVAPAGAVHERFLDYVSRIRVAPVRPYLLYNTWYDLQRLAMNGQNTVARVPQLTSLLAKFNLHLDSFVLDDGWDDMHKLWAIDPQRFPNGFRDLSAALRQAGTNLGIWFGPIGGYDQRQVRIATGRAENMEVTSNGQYLCIAGRNYSSLLAGAMLRYQREYGINYYKLDGIPFGCNEPDHGHPTGIYSREADARVFIGMLQHLREQDPKVFLNITTSIWLSPWWLRYADTVWMGGGDSGYLPTVPTLAPRQSAVSYRDSVLYSDFVTHQAQFPISSLMTHGIIKGKYNMLGGNKESIDDFRDEVVHYYSVGNMMYELYISPDILSPEEIDALGNTTKWAEANAHPLLDNSTLILGDPAQREPYGYVHSSPEKTIVTLRNPFVRPRTVTLSLDAKNGFAKTDRPQTIETIYPYRESRPGTVKFGDAISVDLGAYEQIVLEIQPAAAQQFRMEGKRYSAAGPNSVRVYSETENAPAITFSAPQVDERTIAVQVHVPPQFQQTRFAVLLEPDKEIRNVKATGSDNGKPAAVLTENGGRGLWHWFWIELAPGDHDVRLAIDAAPGHLSGWVLAKEKLSSREIAATGALPQDLLPVSTDMRRVTVALFDKTR